MPERCVQIDDVFTIYSSLAKPLMRIGSQFKTWITPDYGDPEGLPHVRAKSFLRRKMRNPELKPP